MPERISSHAPHPRRRPSMPRPVPTAISLSSRSGSSSIPSACSELLRPRRPLRRSPSSASAPATPSTALPPRRRSILCHPLFVICQERHRLSSLPSIGVPSAMAALWCFVQRLTSSFWWPQPCATRHTGEELPAAKSGSGFRKTGLNGLVFIMGLIGLGLIGLSFFKFGLVSVLRGTSLGIVGYGLKPFDALWATNRGYNPVCCVQLPTRCPDAVLLLSSCFFPRAALLPCLFLVPPPRRHPPAPPLPCTAALPSPSGATPSLRRRLAVSSLRHRLAVTLRRRPLLRRATFPSPAGPAPPATRCSGGNAGKVLLLVPSSSATTIIATSVL
ncbi:uncharacterized protein LOC125533716 isoform X2 [Triticum urartu]|uniref:uncharacterized protein LOC125533716 isoform X2 n=1 Tax=Triticum urartu TaxID=4572 RepID=UPI002043DEB0|nr:uncharacterized protein LOC125533716 isoform X2 [Triticum urartu]